MEKITVTMLSRFFDLRTAGLSRIANNLYRGFEARGLTVLTDGADGDSLAQYLKYLLYDIPVGLPYRDADIFHAITPLEGIYTPHDRTVVTVPDLIQIKHPEWGGSGVGAGRMRQWGAAQFAKWGYGRGAQARYLACISEETKADLINTYSVPDERVKVIRLGIDERLNPNPRSHDTFRIGYIGQLDRRKRVDLLIKAFRDIPNKDARLWIAGQGPDGDKLRAAAEGDWRISFLGKLADEVLPKFYNSLGAFAFPTAIEGYGLPPVEAMACKIPVILWPDAIIPTDIKSRCLTAPFMADIVNGSLKLSQSTLDSNYQFAKSHSWDACIDQYVQLFRSIKSDSP